MSESIFVPVKPTGPTTPLNAVRNACNAIRVAVDYMKGRGIVASACPAGRKTNGFDMYLITSSQYVVIRNSKRLNRKQVEQEREVALAAVKYRTGVVWGLVLNVCEANGLEVEPAVVQ